METLAQHKSAQAFQGTKQTAASVMVEMCVFVCVFVCESLSPVKGKKMYLCLFVCLDIRGQSKVSRG